MPIFDPFGLYPTMSRQSLSLITSDDVNIVWGENPDFTPSDFIGYLDEFTGLVEDGSVPVLIYADTTAMIADQASQTIGFVYQAGSTLYQLTVKTGDISDYTTVIAPAKYNALFNVYAVLASSELSEKRFNDQWKYVMSLYIAHKLSIRFMIVTNTESLSSATDKARAIASQRNNIASSESVGGVSVSYDIGSTLAMGEEGGDWNRTQYGQELVSIIKAYGAISAWIVGI